MRPVGAVWFSKYPTRQVEQWLGFTLTAQYHYYIPQLLKSGLETTKKDFSERFTSSVMNYELQ
jgi:hypothetical protein